MRDIGEDEVLARVDDRALIDACRRALAALGRGEATQGEKQMLPASGGGFFLSLSAVVPELGWAVSKWASYVPGDAGPGRSTSTMLASPADGGEPAAILRGMAPTRLRTAAAALAALEALRELGPGCVVGLIGFGPTNQEVAALLGREHAIARWRVVVRSDAGLVRAVAALPGEVRAAQEASILADCDVVVSATGATSAVARTADLPAGALVLCLDGRRTWDVSGVTELDDHAAPGAPSGLARVLAGELEVPSGRVFVDQAGSAVTDVALVSVVLGERAR